MALAGCGSTASDPQPEDPPTFVEPAEPAEPEPAASCAHDLLPCDCGDGLQGLIECDESGASDCRCEAAVPTAIQSDCMTPCGGDVTGAWRLKDICHPGYAADACGHYQRGGTAKLYPSALGFDGEGHLAGNLALQVQWQLRFAKQCLAVEKLGCYDIEDGFETAFRAADCIEHDDESCNCDVQFQPISSKYAGQPYQVQGDQLTLGNGNFEYCVENDELRLRVNQDEITYVLERVDCPPGAPYCESWDLPFAPVNLGDIGVITAPKRPVNDFGDCEELTLDTDTLTVSCDSEAVITELRHAPLQGEVAVFYFSDLKVTFPLHIKGSRPAVLVAKTMQFFESQRWTGATTGPVGSIGQSAPLGAARASGGGGGHCTPGGYSSSGQKGGLAFDDAGSTALVAGPPGGVSNDGRVAEGGLAVQLVARDSIEVGADASLSVNGDGAFAAQNEGAPGGAAGGTLLLQAPSVTILGKLWAEGGYGGALAVPGSDGTSSAENGFFGEESGGGGAGKLLIFGDTIDVTHAVLSPSPTTAKSCARLSGISGP